MWVGLVIYGSLATRSGGYYYDRRLVAHLQAAGDTVEIVSLPWRNYPRHLLDNLSQGWWRRLEALNVDVLLQDELNHPSLAWVNARLRGRYPIIAIVHHLRSSEMWPGWQRGVYRAVERRYLRSVDGLVFNSQQTKAEVQALSGESKPGVVAVPAGDRFAVTMDADEIGQRAQAQGPLRVVFVGNLIPRKGLETLLAAVRQLPPGCVTVAVIGRQDVDAGYVQRVRRQIAAPGLDQVVTLTGELSDAALTEQLRQSHVLVVPSQYEGFGIVYLEAMGFGLPAIGSTAGAAGEIITPGVDGWLIAPGDAVTLAGYLRQLADDRAGLARMGRAARARFERHPTWDDSMERVRQFLVEQV